MIKKGSIYWVNFTDSGSPGGQDKRPCLVIQNNVLNASRLNTTLVVGITPMQQFGKLPGNVVIEKGVANMPWQGVVNVSQIMSVEKRKIEEEIGALPAEPMQKVFKGLRLIIELE